MTLTYWQMDKLKGFWQHLIAKEFYNGSLDCQFWAKELDGAGIPWFAQNHLSCESEKKEG